MGISKVLAYDSVKEIRYLVLEPIGDSLETLF